MVMVAINGAWTFTQAWIIGSIGLVIAYEATAMTVGARLYRRIGEARASGEIGAAGHARTVAAWSRLGGLLLAILLVVVGLMVFKPGIS